MSTTRKSLQIVQRRRSKSLDLQTRRKSSAKPNGMPFSLDDIDVNSMFKKIIEISNTQKKEFINRLPKSIPRGKEYTYQERFLVEMYERILPILRFVPHAFAAVRPQELFDVYTKEQILFVINTTLSAAKEHLFMNGKIDYEFSITDKILVNSFCLMARESQTDFELFTFQFVKNLLSRNGQSGGGKDNEEEILKSVFARPKTRGGGKKKNENEKDSSKLLTNGKSSKDLAKAVEGSLGAVGEHQDFFKLFLEENSNEIPEIPAALNSLVSLINIIPESKEIIEAYVQGQKERAKRFLKIVTDYMSEAQEVKLKSFEEYMQLRTDLNKTDIFDETYHKVRNLKDLPTHMTDLFRNVKTRVADKHIFNIIDPKTKKPIQQTTLNELETDVNEIYSKTYPNVGYLWRATIEINPFVADERKEWWPVQLLLMAGCFAVAGYEGYTWYDNSMKAEEKLVKQPYHYEWQKKIIVIDHLGKEREVQLVDPDERTAKVLVTKEGDGPPKIQPAFDENTVKYTANPGVDDTYCPIKTSFRACETKLESETKKIEETEKKLRETAEAIEKDYTRVDDRVENQKDQITKLQSPESIERAKQNLQKLLERQKVQHETFGPTRKDFKEFHERIVFGGNSSKTYNITLGKNGRPARLFIDKDHHLVTKKIGPTMGYDPSTLSTYTLVEKPCDKDGYIQDTFTKECVKDPTFTQFYPWGSSSFFGYLELPRGDCTDLSSYLPTTLLPWLIIALAYLFLWGVTDLTRRAIKYPYKKFPKFLQFSRGIEEKLDTTSGVLRYLAPAYVVAYPYKYAISHCVKFAANSMTDTFLSTITYWSVPTIMGLSAYAAAHCAQVGYNAFKHKKEVNSKKEEYKTLMKTHNDITNTKIREALNVSFLKNVLTQVLDENNKETLLTILQQTLLSDPTLKKDLLTLSNEIKEKKEEMKQEIKTLKDKKNINEQEKTKLKEKENTLHDFETKIGADILRYADIYKKNVKQFVDLREKCVNTLVQHLYQIYLNIVLATYESIARKKREIKKEELEMKKEEITSKITDIQQVTNKHIKDKAIGKALALSNQQLDDLGNLLKQLETFETTEYFETIIVEAITEEMNTKSEYLELATKIFILKKKADEIHGINTTFDKAKVGSFLQTIYKTIHSAAASAEDIAHLAGKVVPSYLASLQNTSSSKLNRSPRKKNDGKNQVRKDIEKEQILSIEKKLKEAESKLKEEKEDVKYDNLVAHTEHGNAKGPLRKEKILRPIDHLTCKDEFLNKAKKAFSLINSEGESETFDKNIMTIEKYLKIVNAKYEHKIHDPHKKPASSDPAISSLQKCIERKREERLNMTAIVPLKKEKENNNDYNNSNAVSLASTATLNESNANKNKSTTTSTKSKTTSQKPISTAIQTAIEAAAKTRQQVGTKTAEKPKPKATKKNKPNGGKRNVTRKRRNH